MDQRESLTAREVATMCGVTSRTVNRWIKAGYFPGARKAPGRTSTYRIPKDEVTAFVDQMSEGISAQRRGEALKEIGLSTDPLAHPGQRAALTGLAELLQRLETQQAGKLFALVVEDDPDDHTLLPFPAFDQLILMLE
jgi:excisionase family DNA binding protein